MVTVRNEAFSARTQLWCSVIVVILTLVIEVATLNGPNVCMVKQKYNITKRVKYRAPMSVRTYEWCMSIPPRCSKWSTEMRDLTRLETEERIAEVAVCCPGYKMKDVSCVPICPNGRTGHGCSQDCPPNRWGPNCVNECSPCSDHGSCSPVTGECSCQDGWQGESCESRILTSTSTTTTTSVEDLLTKKPATKPTPPSTLFSASSTAYVEISSTPASKFTTATSMTSAQNTSQHIIGTASSRTIPFQMATPTTVPIENIANSKEVTVTGNSQSASEKSVLEITTVKINLFATPASNIVTTTNVKPAIFHNKATNDTLINPDAKESVISSILNGHATIEQKIYKENASIQIKTSGLSNLTTVYNNMSLATFKTEVSAMLPTQNSDRKTIYNRTESSQKTKIYPKEVHVEIKTTPVKILRPSDFTNAPISQKTTALSIFTDTPIVTTHATTITNGTAKFDTTRRPDATIRYFPTTVKFKPKEIWIRPAQKGESFESKKSSESHTRHRIVTNKEPPSTTPKTIIVSIIPTSVSYAMFKKIALTTASVVPQSTNMTLKSSGQGITRPMSVLTTLSPLSSNITTTPTSSVAHSSKSILTKSVKTTSKSNEHLYKVTKTISPLSNTGKAWRNKTAPLNGTNSMATVTQNPSNFITTTASSTNIKMTTYKASIAHDKEKDTTSFKERVTKPIIKLVTSKPFTSIKSNDTDIISKSVKMTNATIIQYVSNTKTITTESPEDQETFHILTEPEHITAVMEGKEKQRTSVDLISVISIAGGIMMAVITVAVIIVMVERCRRPRYEDVRKMNDIHMQVMIDNNDVPPPYVRSIFHTPLPDPPTSDKCHYQPISTLDRNLKQFMRPVVVQTISPIMLENFRGILECHYDHLPRRSHDFEARHCFLPPSNGDVHELSRLRPCSFTESTIDALKCEAKLDVLDSTTSEPLYAEIPCWRPPSEHAIEILNYNGEAVTEL